MNILYLVNQKYYIGKMSRVRFHGMKAISKLTNVTWWGPGWEGYDNSHYVQENIDMLEEKPDLIVTYKPLENSSPPKAHPPPNSNRCFEPNK